MLACGPSFFCIIIIIIIVNYKPGNHDVKKLQKTIHTRHCTHTSESSNVKRTKEPTQELEIDAP